ncbi:TonB-dependent siderophore receptor, partial [Pseudomonas sp. MWU13-2625]
SQNVPDPSYHPPKPGERYYQTNPPRGGATVLRSQMQGLYYTLGLKLADPLTRVMGSRVSWYKSQNDSVAYWRDTRTPSSARSKETGEVTPFAGVLYDLNDNLTAYASYSSIFTPQGSYRTLDGASLKPLVGKSYEAGIKGEWFDGRLNS